MFRVQGAGFRVQGSGFRVKGLVRGRTARSMRLACLGRSEGCTLMHRPCHDLRMCVVCSERESDRERAMERERARARECDRVMERER